MWDGLLLECLSLVFNACKQIVEGVREALYTFILQLPGDLIVRDANRFEGCQLNSGLWDIVLDAAADTAMIAEAFDGFECHGIYGIWADQLFGVKYVAISGIFRTGTGP